MNPVLTPMEQAFVDQWKRDLKVETKSDKTKAWLKKEIDLIERFKKLSPLSEPFDLWDGSHVFDPKKFHEQMAGDIAAGPRCPRAITGAFQADLEQYIKIQTVLRKLAR